MHMEFQTLEIYLEKQHHIKQFQLFENPTSTRGSTTRMGRNIGVARPRVFEYSQVY